MFRISSKLHIPRSSQDNHLEIKSQKSVPLLKQETNPFRTRVKLYFFFVGAWKLDVSLFKWKYSSDAVSRSHGWLADSRITRARVQAPHCMCISKQSCAVWHACFMLSIGCSQVPDISTIKKVTIEQKNALISCLGFIKTNEHFLLSKRKPRRKHFNCI